MSQSAFTFEETHDYSPENFLISPANAEAYQYIKNFPWSSYAFSIHGPKGSGKTYLANILIKNLSSSGLTRGSGANLHELDVLTLDPRPEIDIWPEDDKLLIIENIDEKTNQQELLHKLNSTKEAGKYILLTSEQPLEKINFTLPDLISRLSAIPSIAISVPDSELFYQLFARYFAARQVKPGDDVINFLATRVERSFAAALNIVAQIDKLSLEQKRNITIPLVKKILAK